MMTAIREQRRQARKKRREVRRAKKEISHLQQKINKAERELDYLKQHRECLAMSLTLEELLPEWAAVADSKSAVMKIVDLFLRVNTKLQQKPADPTWPGIKRFLHEVATLQPFLSSLKFKSRHREFLEENKISLWLAFCTEHSVHEDGCDCNVDHTKWTVDEARSAYDTFTRRLWALSGWPHCGRSFRVTSLLTNTFSVADIPVSPEFLKPPFQVMLFEVPSRFIVKHEGQDLRVTNMLVVFNDADPPDTNFPMLTITASSAHPGAPKMIYNVPFGRCATIQEDIQLFIKHLIDYVPEGTMIGAEKLHYEKENNPVYQIVNFICNIILYCTSFPDDVLPHNEAKLKKLQERLARQRGRGIKEKRTQRKLHQAQSDSILIVGRNFQLTDERASEELSYEDGRRIRLRHIVRGHWRNQACGPRHQERKLIFVQPHWRGVGKEVPSKMYVVK